ncbi:ribosome maturation factor RimM [Arenicella chitinivorans]|uniref:Ribosome maturation factor RimM n=1 Tax=Arenicella chitinivorans TaxID=1329800 RepID=A0A918VK09_9GAMM|nr:ribosome maturation factor RimM [Arenicella chitinivorans]GHA07704.1 ribosome maturation factor RimM [Arenicella chitinivorans]
MYVELGKVVGVWGVKGWIKLHSYTRHRADIAHYKTWYLQPPRQGGDPEAIEIRQCREQGQGIVAQLEGITDRDQAMSLNGYKIFVHQRDLPELPAGEFYWHQLVGLQVRNSDGDIGAIDSILETGANDVLVCKNSQSGQPDVLIPYIDQVVLGVDLDAGTMTVDWDPSYLLE